MSSLQRAYLLGFFLIVTAVATYGRAVQRWTKQEVFGAIAAGSAVAVGVLQKSPRDAAREDDPKSKT